MILNVFDIELNEPSNILIEKLSFTSFNVELDDLGAFEMVYTIQNIVTVSLGRWNDEATFGLVRGFIFFLFFGDVAIVLWFWKKMILNKYIIAARSSICKSTYHRIHVGPKNPF